MPYKNISKRREAQKRYYYKNLDKYRIKNSNRRQMLQSFVNSLKFKECFDCKSFFPPYVMDFDHRDGGTKVNDVARLVREGWSKTKILIEIEKCDLVCSNCHRIRTYKRNQKVKALKI